MIQANSVLSTPPTNTPIDTTRRRFLSQAAGVAAGGAAVAALGVAAMPASAHQCDAEIVAAGAKFETLLTKWLPVWLEWARLWRDAQEETEAKFGEENLDNTAWHLPLIGTAPATIFLIEAIERNGCDRASQAQCDIFEQMVPLAELIRESEATSLAGLRAKTLVSMLDFWPGFADHDGNLSFDVAETSHYSIFSGAVAVTGLADFVGDIEKRLIADAGATLRDRAPIVA
jgi:hypothetical protein